MNIFDEGIGRQFADFLADVEMSPVPLWRLRGHQGAPRLTLPTLASPVVLVPTVAEESLDSRAL